jgi:hypothetical protein
VASCRTAIRAASFLSKLGAAERSPPTAAYAAICVSAAMIERRAAEQSERKPVQLHVRGVFVRGEEAVDAARLGHPSAEHSLAVVVATRLERCKRGSFELGAPALERVRGARAVGQQPRVVTPILVGSEMTWGKRFIRAASCQTDRSHLSDWTVRLVRLTALASTAAGVAGLVFGADRNSPAPPPRAVFQISFQPMRALAGVAAHARGFASQARSIGVHGSFRNALSIRLIYFFSVSLTYRVCSFQVSRVLDYSLLDCSILATSTHPMR